MKLPRRHFMHLAAGAAALPAVSRIAGAETYPTRPVRIISPFGTAGANDLVARLIGQWLSERLGQQFVIENRPGAGGTIGTEAAVRAPADGYTLLMAGAYNAINATLYDKLSFNFIRDIAPVAPIIRLANVSKPWLEVGAIDDFPGTGALSLPAATIGLGVFLAVVSSLFALFISAYLMRMQVTDWAQMPAPQLLWFNTGVLILSSVALQYAQVAARSGWIEGVGDGLLVGGLFAVTFLVGQLLA